MATLILLRTCADAGAALVWRGRCAWRRVGRRHGWLPVLLPVCLLVSCAAWSLDKYQGHRLLELQRQAMVLDAARARPTAVPLARPTSETRLHAFEQLLVPYDGLADVLQELLRLGTQDGLTMQRGDYRLQTDAVGGFVRYHMTIPVKGSPQAVQRLIQQALLGERALALASVQFRRERPDSPELEASIEWVVHARLPDDTSPGQIPAEASP